MDMATSARLSLEDYFRAHYQGQCEFVDGELRPKPMGTGPHARVQARLRDALRRFEQAGQGEALPEMSLWLPNGDILIPDILFSAKGQAFNEQGIFDTPPVLCIEIISPSQSFAELHDKCRRYLRWGVASCWVIDPVKRTAWQIDQDEAPREIATNGSLRAGTVAVSLSQLFQ
jgi:Uma2 family endonuclease